MLDGCIQPCPFHVAILGTDPKKDDSRHEPSRAKDEIAKILVLGKQQTTLFGGTAEDVRIRESGRLFRHLHHVMAVVAQLPDQRAIDAFVGKPEQG